MTGIYRFLNIKTNLSYIGQSIDIEKRLKEHKRKAFQKGKEYYKKLYKAIREDGLENFSFEILEICEKEELNEREKYWIEYFDSFNNGYNATAGGDGFLDANVGEKHPNHKLTEKQVYEIRERYKNREYVYEVYEDYKDIINQSGFHKVWNGYTWKNIHYDVYTEENKEFHKWVRNAHPGRSSGTGKQISKEEVIDIRKRLKTESKDDIWLDYKDKIKHKQNFNDICNYKTYKNIIV